MMVSEWVRCIIVDEERAYLNHLRQDSQCMLSCYDSYFVKCMLGRSRGLMIGRSEVE